jgi:MFS family permease
VGLGGGYEQAKVGDDGSPVRTPAHKSRRGQPGRQPGARFALAILTAINLLNYIDRYVPSSVKDLIKTDLRLTDAETSWPLTAMILVYMVSSPVFGWISDHQLVGRRQLLTAAVIFW